MNINQYKLGLSLYTGIVITLTNHKKHKEYFIDLTKINTNYMLF